MPSSHGASVCQGCGFWLSPGVEVCPGCGLAHSDERWWARLTRGREPLPEEVCLRRQELGIARELKLLDADLAKLEAQATSVRDRIEKAEAGGRDPAVLRRSQVSLDDAIEHQRQLHRRYRTLLYGVQLDWLENDLVYQGEARFAEGIEREPEAEFNAQDGWATCVSIRADSQVFATGGHDNTVRLWDIGRRRGVGTLKGFTSWATGLAFAPDGGVLAAACRGAGAELWDVGQRVRLDVAATSPEVTEVAFSPDGRWLAMSINRFYGSHALKVHDLRDETEGHLIETPYSIGRAFAFDPRSEYLAYRAGDSSIAFLDLRTGEEARTIDGPGAAVLAFSRDGRWLACGTAVRDAATGEVAASLWDGAAPSCLAFSPDGDWLAVGATGGTVSLWAVGAWSKVVTVRAHERSVQDVAISSDGRWLVTAGDGGAKLWLLPRLLGGTVRRFAGAAERIGADEEVCSSGDGLRLFERSQELLGRAIRASVRRLGRQVEAVVAGEEGVSAAAVSEALGLLFEHLDVMRAGSSQHLAHFQDLVDELPVRAFGPAVEDLLEAVERQTRGLRDADEGACSRRLAALQGEELRGQEMISAFDRLPVATRERPAAAALRTTLQRTLDQIPELIDLVVARQTAAALGSLDPIAERAPLDALGAQREALEDAIMSLAPTPVDDEPLAALQGRVEVLQELDERAAVIRSIEEERHRFATGADAVEEVDRLLDEG